MCPANSVSEEEGLTQCTCLEGYYRAPQLQGEEDLPCHCILIEYNNYHGPYYELAWHVSWVIVIQINYYLQVPNN